MDADDFHHNRATIAAECETLATGDNLLICDIDAGRGIVLFDHQLQRTINKIVYIIILTFLCLTTITFISCTSAKQLPDNVLEIRRSPEKTVVRFKDKGPIWAILTNYDYKSRYATLKDIALNESNFCIYDNFGVSLLALAAANGDAGFVSFLLKQGATFTCDVDPDEEENPPVHLVTHPVELAIDYGHYDVLKLLLEHGYKPCCVVVCVSLDRLDMLKLLHEHGANIDDNSISWAAPLISYAKSVPMVEYPVSQGCSINTALAYAKSHYSTEEAAKTELLINKALSARRSIKMQNFKPQGN